MGFFGKVFGADPKEPDDAFLGLRSRVLELEPDELEASNGRGDPIYGILMETGLSGGSATFVCLKDGTVSLYTSTGGGVIGAGAHEPVRAACLELLEWSNGYARELMGASVPTKEFPLPERGAVFFYLLTTSGVYLARCSEDELLAHEDPFANLFSACHVVLTEAREATQRHRAGE